MIAIYARMLIVDDFASRKVQLSEVNYYLFFFKCVYFFHDIFCKLKFFQWLLFNNNFHINLFSVCIKANYE